MAKNKFGNFLAFTTTVAAIGTTCYIFRDKIKESTLYQKAINALAALLNTEEDFAEEDFFLDDDFEKKDESSIFSEDNKGREYTSITINGKDNSPLNLGAMEINGEEPDETIQDEMPVQTTNTNTEEPVHAPETNDEEPAQAFEYEGLSDVYEDPNTLEEQDKLDF